jgi:D-glycero-D-manno-heptose 1,7-bisphosphate phosphatase
MNDRTDGSARGAIFFDRDGVLNVDREFVHRVEDFQWVDGAREAVKMVNQAGLYTIVVTNQSGVARGFFGEEDVRKLHDWMARDLATIDARIDAFYYCPYLEDAKVAAYRVADHPDRKPNPGMILRGLRDFGVEASRATLIGDKETDLVAARRAGIGARLFEGGSLAATVGEVLSKIQHIPSPAAGEGGRRSRPDEG